MFKETCSRHFQSAHTWALDEKWVAYTNAIVWADFASSRTRLFPFCLHVIGSILSIYRLGFWLCSFLFQMDESSTCLGLHFFGARFWSAVCFVVCDCSPHSTAFVSASLLRDLNFHRFRFCLWSVVFIVSLPWMSCCFQFLQFPIDHYCFFWLSHLHNLLPHICWMIRTTKYCKYLRSNHVDWTQVL